MHHALAVGDVGHHLQTHAGAAQHHKHASFYAGGDCRGVRWRDHGVLVESMPSYLKVIVSPDAFKFYTRSLDTPNHSTHAHAGDHRPHPADRRYMYRRMEMTLHLLRLVSVR